MYKIQEGMFYADGNGEWHTVGRYDDWVEACKVADQYAFEEKGAWCYRLVDSDNNVIRSFYWHEGGVVEMNESDRPVGLIFAQRQWDALISALDDFEADIDGWDVNAPTQPIARNARYHLTTIRSLVHKLKGE